MLPGHDTNLFMLSNFDITGAAALRQIPLDGAQVLMVETAMIGEGRTLAGSSDIVAYELRDARVRVFDFLSASADQTQAAIAQSDVIHFCGGNTFFLLDAIRRSGADRALADRATRGALTCVGESAGAIIFGRDIAHVAAIDAQEMAPALTSTTGLGWTEDLLVPHFKGEAWGFGEKIDAWLATDPNAAGYTLLHEEAFLHITPRDRRLHGPAGTDCN